MTNQPFKQPENPNVRIWRYMDFTKYVAMLENKGLYFSRADLIGDPFEGSFTKVNIQRRKSTLNGASVEKANEDFFEWLGKLRAYSLLNCWHMNEHESAAMWKLYSKSNESIAVRSRFDLLRSTLSANIDIGVVTYIDYETDVIPEGNAISPIMHKRKSFEHERELRAVWWLLGDESYVPHVGGSPPPPPDRGKWQKANLVELIEEIYVAPMSPEWFRELVKQVGVKYDLAKNVHQSKLDDTPLF